MFYKTILGSLIVQKSIKIFLAFFLISLNISSSHAQFSSIFGSSQTRSQQRKAVLKTNSEILKNLYAIEPQAKLLIERSQGYAVFSDFGMKILVAGGGSGKGAVYQANPKKIIFMDMLELQAGLGLGITSFQMIFVFQTQQAMDDFVNSGWTFGGQASAAAKYENQGDSYQGAQLVAPGILAYQLINTGLAVDITAIGTKFYKDFVLN
jgi:lipid-binding SYLF domain-containing protein